MRSHHSFSVVFLFILLIALLLSCQSTQKSNRPNVIFIMVDDLGYADLGSFGNPDTITPNIDLFVNQGLKFTNAYASAPYCSPTRVAFMTGKYPRRFEIGLKEPLTLSETDLQLGLSPSIPTITSLLSENGYETALYGKWHLGQIPAYLPSKHGVDSFFGIMCGAADHIDHKPFDRYKDLLFKREIPNLYENDRPVTKKGYLNNLITEYAVSFIEKQRSKPFFLSVQFTAPHWPWQTPDDAPVDSLSYTKSGTKETYRRMLRNLDSNFRDIMRSLERANLSQSTLIIFTNDNGGAKFANHGLLKGNKGSLNEGGIRVPAAVRGPKEMVRAGVSNQAVITTDWTKTILEACQCAVPEDLTLDGTSLLDHFKNHTPLEERILFWQIANRKKETALRQGDWKYLSNKEGVFLYNLRNDIGETIDLKEEQKAIFNALREHSNEYKKQMLQPAPTIY